MKLATFGAKDLRRLEYEAKQTNSAAEEAVYTFLTGLETRYKIPIRFERVDSTEKAAGTCRTMWQQRTPIGHHTIDLAPCDPLCQMHRLAHELIHFELECTAHEAGTRKTDCLAPSARKSWRERWSYDSRADWFVREVFSTSINYALDLIVEKRLKRDFPILYSAQLLSLHRLQKEQVERGDIARIGGPPEFTRAIRALEAAAALAVDKLSENRMQHFLRFRTFEESTMAQELYKDFIQGFTNLGPGDHYHLVDRFCAKIGFPGLHIWDPRPAYDITVPRAYTTAEDVLAELAPKPR